jgi:enamine deaminase RidA (YjgF/YER057c/UK114 family)
MSIDERLKHLGIELPEATTPLANYVGGARVGSALMLSGHIPLGPDGKLMRTGRLGDDVTIEEGYSLARQVGINLLGTARALAGDLAKVRRVVKAVGFIRSAPGFADQPKVLNGFSDLMVEVFGREIGAHARSAVGVPELPLGAPVEVELVLDIAD